jgi:hypothetical protein
MSTIMKRRRHTPEQAVRKIREGERLLNGGGELVEVLRQLEVSEETSDTDSNRMASRRPGGCAEPHS